MYGVALQTTPASTHWVQEEPARQRLQSTGVEKDANMSVCRRTKELEEAEEEEENVPSASSGHQHSSQDNVGKPSPFLSLLTTCAKQKDLSKGTKLHSEILSGGLLKKDIYVGSALVNMYAKCGALAKAREVIDKLPFRNSVSWNGLLTGYVQHGCTEEAITCFQQMQLAGHSPTPTTFVIVSNACASLGAIDKGQEIHAHIISRGELGHNVIVGTALVDMYAKFSLLGKAQEVFDDLEVRNVVSWNALIAGYAQQAHAEKALDCFEQMQLDGFPPNEDTYPSILKACGCIGALYKGQEIHGEIAKHSALSKDVVIITALIDMYAKCNLLVEAQEMFDELSTQDVVTWNALINGYAQHGHDEKALNCFEQMTHEGFLPNAVTFICILRACGSIGATYKSQVMHSIILKKGLLEKDMAIGNALVDMYAKCGMPMEARGVFDRLQARDVVSCNALMSGYGQFGEDEWALNLLHKMVRESIKPDLVTLTIVLNTCCHRGLLDKCQVFFETMSSRYGIIPMLEHHNCMVDLFGRAGQIDEAVAVLEEMPICDDISVINILMGACRKWGDLKFARWAFAQGTHMDERDGEAYVCMWNILSASGRPRDEAEVKFVRV